MAKKDDVIAATGGGGDMVSRWTKRKRWRQTERNELSALLLEHLGFPDGSVTIEGPTDELKAEGLPATVKVTKPDGTEIDGRKVAQALQDINDKLGTVKTWQIRHTVISGIAFIIGLIGGEFGWAGTMIEYFFGSSGSGNGLY